MSPLSLAAWHVTGAQRCAWLSSPITIWAHREPCIGTTNNCGFKMTPATSPLPTLLCRGEGLTSAPSAPGAGTRSEQLGGPTALPRLMHMYGVTLFASAFVLCVSLSLSPREERGRASQRTHRLQPALPSLFWGHALVQSKTCSQGDHKGCLLHRPPERKPSLQQKCRRTVLQGAAWAGLPPPRPSAPLPSSGWRGGRGAVGSKAGKRLVCEARGSS